MNLKNLLTSDEHDDLESITNAGLTTQDQTVRRPGNIDIDELMAGCTDPVKLIVCELTRDQVDSLVSAERNYALGLRIILLRTLLRTQAANSMLTTSGFGINRVLEFLGFSNYARCAKERTFAEMRVALSGVLNEWAAEFGQASWFPSSLQTNLENLAEVVDLSETDKTLFGFAVLLHAEPLLEHCTDLMGSELSGLSVHIPLAQILDIPTAEIESALSQESKLHSSGLLTVDCRGRFYLKQILDLLTPSFHARMTVRQKDIRNVVAGFVKPASAANLGSANYEYVSDFCALVRDYLQATLASNKKGANILIHGAPGTGKSQFARAVASDIGVNLMEISPTNLAGDAITPMRRRRSYGIAQAFYCTTGYMLLFDEIEEVVAAEGFDHSAEDATIAQKSSLNALLENNHTPAIWITNDISEFDPAYIRRFDICIEMPVPPLSVRLHMLKDAFTDKAQVSYALLKSIARNDAVTPALIQQAARVTSMVSGDHGQPEREKLLVSLLNEKLRAQQLPALNYKPNEMVFKKAFDPALVNCQVDLAGVMQALRDNNSARMCLYGPPGTGKTAFGKWVAQELEVPHMVLTASTLLSKFVGGTEKNIARAFAAAKRDGAVLQFDEVDTFLTDRRQADRGYEMSRVNEMLVQMESFDGVFIASTNLVDHLDEASLRRFDMAVTFDFITHDAASIFFRHACKALDLQGDQANALARLSGLHCLTPGDFDQVLRRARLTGMKDEHALIDALEDAVALKKSTPRTSIGFLKAT